MTESSKVSPRWDALIIELVTRKVAAVAGSNLLEEGSFHTEGKPLNALKAWLNANYGMVALPAGKFKKGDVLPPDVNVFAF